MTHFSRSRTAAALATTAFLTAAPVLAATSAEATTDGGCQSATVQYRLVDGDGKPVGTDWTSQGGFHQWTAVPGTVEVRLAPGQTVGDGCKYPVSLAEYSTEGSNWYTSGHQTLVDHATVYLTSADVAGSDDARNTWPKLSVKSPDCYGQIDLYGDDIIYDGQTGEGHGPAPYQPGNVATPYHLIAAWNGGNKPCTDQPGSPTPTPSQSTPATPPASQPPAQNSTPPTTPTPVTSSTPPTTPDVPPLQSTPPTTPKPSPSDSTPPLAETGSSAPVGLIAGGGAAVIALGGAALYTARRTRRS